MKTQINKLLTLMAGAALFVSSNAKAQIFTDAFTTDTSANWTIRAAALTNVVDDYTVQFGFRYSTNLIRTGFTNTIPLAPNSTIGIATNGVKVTVNKNDGAPDASGVNLYPNGCRVVFKTGLFCSFQNRTDYLGRLVKRSTGFYLGSGAAANTE